MKSGLSTTRKNQTVRGARAGFMMLELIIVVIVIAVLTGWYFRGGNSPEQAAASQYKMSMDRSKATACMASRMGLRSVIMTYTMQNPGKPVTTDALKQAGVNLNVCPEGGVISVAPDQTLVCSIHQQ